MDGLVSVEWLAANLDRKDLVVLDCSVDASQDAAGAMQYQSGRALFCQSRIPGAAHADLVAQLSDPESGALFALPEPEAFRRTVQKLGVRDGATIVLYDRSFTAWAARVWWMLRWIGFDSAVILDGGLTAWLNVGHDTSSGPADEAETGALTMQLRPGVIARQADVLGEIGNTDTCLIDTLSASNFQGETDDYARKGHITGATNAFSLDMFETDGRFKPAAVLAEMHGGTKSSRHITYCGAGILASATAFVLVQLGYKDVSMYAASLQEWAADPANPMET